MARRRSWPVWGSGAETFAVSWTCGGADDIIDATFLQPRARFRLGLEWAPRDAIMATLPLRNLHDAIAADVLVVMGPEEVAASAGCSIVCQAYLALP